MKIILTALVFVGLTLVTSKAQDIPAMAWQSLCQEQKSLKEAVVLGAQLTENNTGQVWEFQLLDSNYKSDRRIVQWTKGKLNADSAGRMKAFSRDDLIPLEPLNLEGSVAPVRAKVKQLLEDAKKKAYSVQYALSRKEGQEQPQWNVTCLSEDEKRLAVMSFNTDSNQLVQVDLEPGNPKSQTVESEAKSFGRDVEKTFKGVGADLEEFFTGKRSVDK
jgi:uncharacterized protein YpmB